MNCINHDYRAAVVGCARCGCGLCRDCMVEAVSFYNSHPLCPACSKTIAQQELLRAQKSRRWSVVKFIFSAFFIVLALLAYAGGTDIKAAWILAGIAGAPMAFMLTRRSKEQRLMDEIQDRVESNVISMLLRFVIRIAIQLLVIFALAPVCAVISCVSNFRNIIVEGRNIDNSQRIINKQYCDKH